MDLKEAFTCRIYLSSTSRSIVDSIVDKIMSKYSVNVRVKESINVSDFYLLEFTLDKPIDQRDVEEILINEGLRNFNFKVDVLRVKVP